MKKLKSAKPVPKRKRIFAEETQKKIGGAAVAAENACRGLLDAICLCVSRYNGRSRCE
jgi:hypothetical protein